MGSVIAHQDDVRPVGAHAVHRVGDGARNAGSRPALGDERQAPVRQLARVEVVPGTVGELHKARAVGVAAEEVVATPAASIQVLTRASVNAK